MEPDNGLNNKQNETEETVITSSTNETIITSTEPTEASSNNGDDASAQGKPKKKSHAMAIGMVFLVILAIGGIGFGVWAMMDGNAKVAKKDEKISELNTQLAEAAESIVKEETTVVNTDVVVKADEDMYKNPVIKSEDSAEAYRLHFDSSPTGASDGANIVSIDIKDGVVEKCSLSRRTYDTPTGGHTTAPIIECNISGLDGEIFKAVQFGSGQDSSLDRIGFIMTDGSVRYTLPIREAISSNDLSVKGSLTIDGGVGDAVNVSVADMERGYGGYGATVFVMDDGNYVKYDDSML